MPVWSGVSVTPVTCNAATRCPWLPASLWGRWPPTTERLHLQVCKTLTHQSTAESVLEWQQIDKAWQPTVKGLCLQAWPPLYIQQVAALAWHTGCQTMEISSFDLSVVASLTATFSPQHCPFLCVCKSGMARWSDWGPTFMGSMVISRPCLSVLVQV